MNITSKISTLVLLIIMAFNFTSCTEELAEAVKQGEEQESEQLSGENGRYDEEYAQTMEDQFESDVEVENDCFHMKDRDYRTKFKLPHKRPRHSGAYQDNSNGMGIDGSKIEKSDSKWKFQTSPYTLASQSKGRMIGVHKDGSPIYVNYTDEDKVNLDSNGGTYGKTNDFPEGIYYYVITLNVNY
jgi:hypothetical protein